MSPQTQLNLLELYSTILTINMQAYDRLIKNIEDKDYCSRKDTAIKAAAWELINDEIRNFIEKETKDGNTCTRDRS